MSKVSKIICPLGLIDNCQSSFKSGRGCRNYDYCENTASLTISLPYVYNERMKGLYVTTTYPQVLKWISFRYFSYGYQRHELVFDSHEELEKLGFAVAVDIPNFNWDVFNKFNPPDETDNDIPF